MDICLIATSNMERKNYFLQCLKTLSPLFPKLPSYIWLLFKSFFLNISPEIVPTSVKCSPFNFSNDITNYIDLTGLLFYRVCKNKRRRANSVNFNKNINRWWFTHVTCPKSSFDRQSFICLYNLIINITYCVSKSCFSMILPPFEVNIKEMPYFIYLNPCFPKT